MSDDDSRPLILGGDRQARRDAEDDHINHHISWLAPAGEESYLHDTRRHTQRLLSSKVGHYTVLLLVSLDVSIIFADFLISLVVCEHQCGKATGGTRDLQEAQSVLGIVSLIFSCLFMAELVASIWAYGLPYFKSWFHCFDAAVIVAGFLIDVCLKGALEEVGSIVIVLRLWRAFKIIEELSAGAEEQMNVMSEVIEKLRMENSELKSQVQAIKTNGVQ